MDLTDFYESRMTKSQMGSVADRSSGNDVSQELTESRTRLRFKIAALLVVLFCAAIGCYFCALQDLYYSHYQPFFDSLGYYDQMHAVMTTGQQEGFGSSLAHAMNSGSTVFMPYLLASLLALVVEPSRNLGVWMQVFELGILMVSVSYYFYRVKKIDPLPGLLLLVPFVLTTCLYRNNGGVSDFRMDLSLYLTYSITCVWYLIATKTGQKTHFLFVGLAIAAACLFRATAPVYLILGLAPLAVMDVLRAKNRQPVLIGLAVAFSAAVAGSIWFYIYQYDKLYYYYFVWNADANAKLSMVESSAHVKFALKHIGDQFLIWIIALNVLALLATSKQESTKVFVTAKRLLGQTFRETDYRLVWLAVAPLAMLVFRGAGLNQFVCMPAIVGVLLLLLSPLANNKALFASRPALLSAALVSLICVGLIGFDGWNRHKEGDYNSMAAHKIAINEIVSDAKAEGLQDVNFGSTHVFYINSASLNSTMRFDTPAVSFDGRKMFVDDVRMIANGIFSGVVADANWEALAGATQEKLDGLLSYADKSMDYVIVPDDSTIDFLEEKIAFNIINQHQRYLKAHIVQGGNWVPVTEVIENGKHERVTIYRNRSKTRIAQQLNLQGRAILR